MGEYQNVFNVEEIVNKSSINGEENIASLINQLNDMKRKIRINVKDSASSSRLSFERYLKIKYRDMDNSPIKIIKDQRKNQTLNNVDYNVLQCLRLFANVQEHSKLFDKYKDKISRNTVYKIFALFLALISNNYSKYFKNINNIIKSYNYDGLDLIKGAYLTQEQLDMNANKTYEWLFEFVNKLLLNDEINDCLYDFPIKDYEIIKKYPADFDYSRHLIFEKYEYIAKKQEEEYYYYVVPNIQTIEVGKRNNNVDSIASNKDDTHDLMTKSHSIEFERINSHLVRAYDFYKIKNNTIRLDEYLSNRKDQINKSEALLIIKKIVDILLKYQNSLSLRNLDEKSIFVTESNGDIKINVGSFKYAKIKDQWKSEIRSETVGPLLMDNSKKSEDYFSAISVNSNLLDDTDNENYPEKMDVYSLIVLLAYIMDKNTGIYKAVSSSSFSSFSAEFRNAISKSIKADSFDEILSLEEFNSYIYKEITND